MTAERVDLDRWRQSTCSAVIIGREVEHFEQFEHVEHVEHDEHVVVILGGTVGRHEPPLTLWRPSFALWTARSLLWNQPFISSAVAAEQA
jgi:hypothetical protein